MTPGLMSASNIFKHLSRKQVFLGLPIFLVAGVVINHQHNCIKYFEYEKQKDKHFKMKHNCLNNFILISNIVSFASTKTNLINFLEVEADKTFV